MEENYSDLLADYLFHKQAYLLFIYNMKVIIRITKYTPIHGVRYSLLSYLKLPLFQAFQEEYLNIFVPPL